MLGGEQPAGNQGAQPKKAVKVDVLNMVDRLVERAEHSYDPEKVPPVKEWVERHMVANCYSESQKSWKSEQEDRPDE